jgi:acyl-CoA thioesterase
LYLISSYLRIGKWNTQHWIFSYLDKQTSIKRNIMTLKDILNDRDRYAKVNGIQLTSIGKGTAEASMTVGENHLNAGNICQGGALFTLADLVFAALVNQGEYIAFGINSTIYYHVAAKLGDVLTASGELTSPHYKIPSATVFIHNANGVLIASFTAQGYVKKIPAAYSTLE